jgi:hypothetical protein
VCGSAQFCVSSGEPLAEMYLCASVLGASPVLTATSAGFNVTAQSGVVVLQPTSTTIWSKGQQYPISWFISGEAAGRAVSLSLFNDHGLVADMGAHVVSPYSFAIPGDIGSTSPSSTYRVRVELPGTAVAYSTAFQVSTPWVAMTFSVAFPSSFTDPTTLSTAAAHWLQTLMGGDSVDINRLSVRLPLSTTHVSTAVLIIKGTPSLRDEPSVFLAATLATAMQSNTSTMGGFSFTTTVSTISEISTTTQAIMIVSPSAAPAAGGGFPSDMLPLVYGCAAAGVVSLAVLGVVLFRRQAMRNVQYSSTPSDRLSKAVTNPAFQTEKHQADVELNRVRLQRPFLLSCGCPCAKTCRVNVGVDALGRVQMSRVPHGWNEQTGDSGDVFFQNGATKIRKTDDSHFLKIKKGPPTPTRPQSSQTPVVEQQATSPQTQTTAQTTPQTTALPSGWQEYVTGEGKVYYANSSTNETSWYVFARRWV